MTTQQLRSPLKWIGGKYASASRIVVAFPPPRCYTTYLEPCGGAAHVLMSKPNWGHREIYNDLNDDLVNFWLQVREHADQLVAHLGAQPYSRKLYYDAYRRLFDGSEMDPLERAALFFYALRGTGTGWLRAAPVGWNNTASSAAYRSVLDLFTQVQERLTHPKVLIDNRDVFRVIEEYDSPGTLHYVDPPYIGAEYYYQDGVRKHVKQPFAHERLAEKLNAVQGYVVLSYYPHPDLEQWYPASSWRRLIWHQQKPSTLVAEAVEQDMREATEMLLCNYSQPAPSLWPEISEGGGA